MKFGVMFFASSEEALGDDKYRLVLECAKYADQHEFSSVWVPERHFTEFGSLFPNPAILQSALARETKTLRLCAGSVVLPLHHPLRIVEEWSMVDNLSGGRVGISFASGWNPDDFAFFPDRYTERHKVLSEGLRDVRKLWKERSFKARNGVGKIVERKVFPSPVQAELPIWMTAANSPASFEKAGEIGAHLLTYLLDHTVEELAEKIALYRKARAAHGFDPEAGCVSIMLHTFVGSEAEVVKEQARGPYCQFIKSNIGLFSGLAQSRGESFDWKALSPADLDQFANYLYERFASSRGLIGTPESCSDLVQKLERVGVDEIACLLDFGPSTDLILDNLPHLDRLRSLHDTSPPGAGLVVTGERGAAGGQVETPGGEPTLSVDVTDWPHPATGIKTAADADVSATPASPPPVDRLRGAVRWEMTGDAFYARLRNFGVQFETRFRGIEHLWIGAQEALGQVVLRHELDSKAYQIHPAYMDACLQVLGALVLESGSADAPTSGHPPASTLYLPMGCASFKVYGSLENEVWSHATLSSEPAPDASSYVGDVQISNRDGKLAAEVKGLRLQRVEMSPTEPATPADPRFDLEDWLFDLVWESRPAANAGSSLEPGTWLILADRGGLGQKLADTLTGAGHQVLTVYSKRSTTGDGERLGVDADGARWLDPAEPDAFRGLLDDAMGRRCRGILHLWALDAPAWDEEDLAVQAAGQELAVGSALALTRTLAAMDPAEPPDLWFITRGAQPVQPGDGGAGVTQSPLWGWARTMPLELPRLWRGLADLDPQAEAAESIDHLLAALERRDREDQLAFRGGERFVLRLQHQPHLQDRTPAFRWDPEGTYLITGGLGSFGLRMGRWMVEHGVGNLMLVGRSEPSAEALDEIEQWNALARSESRELRVATRSVDVSRSAEVTELFETLGDDWPPLRGLVHAAGVASQQLIESMTFDHLLEMFGSKVFGTLNLLHCTRGLDLDVFLNISSLSPVWGTKGLAHYAAGNHFLDVLASCGRDIGVPVVTLNIGPMDGGGIASSSDEVKEALMRVGLRMMPPAPVMASIDRLLASDLAQKILADVDWAVFKDLYQATGQGHLLGSIQIKNAAFADGAKATPQWFEELSGARPEHREELLAQHLQTTVARVMKLRGGDLPAKDQGFFDLGMDSLMVLELKTQLQRGLGRELPATLAFEHPTVAGLTGALLDLLFPPAVTAQGGAGVAVAEEMASRERPGTETSFAEEVEELSEEELMAVIESELGAHVS